MNPDPFHYGIIRPYAGMGIGFPNSGPRPSRPFHKKRPRPRAFHASGGRTA